MSEFVNILHLSDLHFGMEPSEKISPTEVDRRNLTLDGLIKTFEKLNKTWRPNLVTISGDIAWKGKQEDYEKADKWLSDKLLPALNLSPERLVVCPGNHDIDRIKTFGMKPPDFSREADEWLKIEHVENFSRPFEAYVSFCENFGMKSPVIGDQFNFLTGAIEFEGVRFVILNSAWFCRGDEDRGNLWLGKPLLEKMASNQQLLDEGSHDEKNSLVTIALFHHPPEWLNESESNTYGDRQSTLEYLSLRSHIILNGHVHARPAAPGWLFNQTWQIKGGASYAEHDYRNHFSILKIDTANRKFDRTIWEFDPGKNKWVNDMETTSSFMFSRPKEKESITGETVCTIPEAYKSWIVNDCCKYMDFQGLQDAGKALRADLPEVFVPLYGSLKTLVDSEDSTKFDFRYLKDKAKEFGVDYSEILASIKMRRLLTQTREMGSIDIEKLIAKNEYLLIEGEAGSGKTTLFKHICHMIVREPDYLGIGGKLPVLVFLKDLRDFDFESKNKNAELAEEIIAHVSNMHDCCLNIREVKSLAGTEKVLFFLDGLDEIEIDHRNTVIKAFEAFRRKNGGGRIYLAGRPHGLAGSVLNLYGDKQISIDPLTMEQTKYFIRKWFAGVEGGPTRTSRKTSEQMIAEIQAHDGVRNLIDTPLMLTAVCILYYDQKELPGQRAELYKKFVSNMLNRRFKKTEKVLEFLMALAHHMHSKKRKGLDRQPALDIMSKVWRKPDMAKGNTEKYIREEFDHVESNCGLTQFDGGQLMFRHLTFQEYLTAAAIVSRERQYDEAIRDLWKDEWYQEVISLYIGLLSLDNRNWANHIVGKAIEKTDHPPFYRSRLAAHSFLDIQEDRRDTDVLDLVVEKLEKIICSDAEPLHRADAGEILGRLGDRRNLEAFIGIPDGKYELWAGNSMFKDFEMSKYQVTNKWYKKFIDDGGYEINDFWTHEGLEWRNRVGARQPEYWDDLKWNCPNYPVVGVCWWEAAAFCQWLTKKMWDGWIYHLPTDQEWEAAAAGKENRKYPWGEDYNKVLCNTQEFPIAKISVVGIFKDGDTPDGLSDMAGNVWEWTSTNFDSNEVQSDFNDKEVIALRGGAWTSYRGLAVCRCKDSKHPDARSNNFGFRCARKK